jgi:hypothetical protein
VANIEKHPKKLAEELDQADFSLIPTRARSSYLTGRYVKSRRPGRRNHVPRVVERAQSIVLYLEDLPATPRNLERIRQRVQLLNRQLAQSGMPFRLRVV